MVGGQKKPQVRIATQALTIIVITFMIWYSRHLSVSDWYTEGEIQVSQLSDQGRRGFIVFVPTEISLAEFMWLDK